jgi:RNA polymerase sigma factor (sigma-70 family)
MSDADRTALDLWAAHRDAEAFNALASRHAAMVYTTCRRILGNATEAEDVAQECFEALAQVSGARKARALGAWLHGVATKRSLQRLRTEQRRRNREARFSQDRAQAAPPVWDDVYEHVDQAIAQLPEKLRGPVVAHFLEGHSHTDIARDLHESRQTVAYRIKTGIERIRKSLRERGVLVTGNALGGALASERTEAIPEAVTASLGRLALAGAGPSAAHGAGSTGLMAYMTVKNILFAAAFLALTAVGAWWVLASDAEPRESGQPLMARDDGGPLDEGAAAGARSTAEQSMTETPASGHAGGATASIGPFGEARGHAGEGPAPVSASPEPDPAVQTETAPDEVVSEQRQDSAQERMVALHLELPDPSFSGTPLDYWSEILELTFKPRAPFLVPDDTALLSRGKPVTSSDVTVFPKKLQFVTDGDKSFEAESVLNLKSGPQYVQIDLGKECAIEAVVVWHFHEYERVYFDVSVRASNDPEFKEGVTVLFNNDHDNSSKLGAGGDKEYVEKDEGKLIDAQGLEARYVRLYSNGNCSDDTNTYVEVEVFGRPVE